MAWVHDLDPVALHVGALKIHWYGISYLVGLLSGWWWLRRWQKQQRIPSADPAFISDFVTTIGIGMVLGGRLGYCALYEPHLFGFISEFPYWGVLAVWKGGMASHGGVIGFALACWYFSARRGVSMGVMGDAIAAAAPFGVIFGRIANFVNGELYGKPTGSDWGVRFANQLNDMPLSQHIAAGHTILSEPPFRSEAWYAWIAQATPSHPSQLYAAALEGVVLGTLLVIIHARHRKPWLTTGCCLIGYAIARIVNEYWRMPDAGQPGGPAGPNGIAVPLIFGMFSKGQIYCLPMVVIGIVLIVLALRRGVKPAAYVPPAQAPAPAITPT